MYDVAIISALCETCHTELTPDYVEYPGPAYGFIDAPKHDWPISATKEVLRFVVFRHSPKPAEFCGRVLFATVPLEALDALT